MGGIRTHFANVLLRAQQAPPRPNRGTTPTQQLQPSSYRSAARSRTAPNATSLANVMPSNSTVDAEAANT